LRGDISNKIVLFA